MTALGKMSNLCSDQTVQRSCL